MNDVGLNPQGVLQAVEEHLNRLPAQPGESLRVAPPTKLALKIAMHHASRAGRQCIEGADVLSAVLEEAQGVPAAILRRHGVEPDTAQIAMLPQNYVKLEGRAAQQMLKLMEALEDHDDTRNVWSNFDVEEQEIEASLA